MPSQKIKDLGYLHPFFSTNPKIRNIDVAFHRPGQVKKGTSRARLNNYDPKSRTLFLNRRLNFNVNFQKVAAFINRLYGTRKKSPSTRLKEKSDEVMKQIHEGTSTAIPEVQRMLLHLEAKREERKRNEVPKRKIKKLPPLTPEQKQANADWEKHYVSLPENERSQLWKDIQSQYRSGKINVHDFVYKAGTIYNILRSEEGR